MIALALIAAAAQQADEPRAQLKCDRGGIERTIAGSEWVAYGCDDGDSVALVSAAGVTPPLHLIVRPSGDSYLVSGDAGADGQTVSAAKDALLALGTAGLRALVEAAQLPTRKR